MDEDPENYVEHLRDIAQGARSSGNAHLMVDAMTLVDRVKGSRSDG